MACNRSIVLHIILLLSLQHSHLLTLYVLVRHKSTGWSSCELEELGCDPVNRNAGRSASNFIRPSFVPLGRVLFALLHRQPDISLTNHNCMTKYRDPNGSDEASS